MNNPTETHITTPAFARCLWCGKPFTPRRTGGKAPEVSRWWGVAEEQLRFLEADLTDRHMRQWIVEYFGRPFAYVQAYPAQAWPQPHLAHLPTSAVVVDLFIGAPTLMGKGHGSAFIRTLAEKLLAEGADAVATDPHYENHQARRAYSHAGFHEEGIVETEDGPVALLVFQSAPCL